MSAAIITASECAALLAALVILLSMIVNVSALLIPAGVALAFAAKDLSHNFVAGAAQMKPRDWSCRKIVASSWRDMDIPHQGQQPELCGRRSLPHLFCI